MLNSPKIEISRIRVSREIIKKLFEWIKLNSKTIQKNMELIAEKLTNFFTDIDQKLVKDIY